MLYNNGIAQLKNTKGWLEEIKCNIEVKQGCLLSSTFFDIYIDKLETCLEEVGCTNTTSTALVIISLLSINDIVLMARCSFDLDKQLRILNAFCSNIGVIVNIDKTKVMIIKSKRPPMLIFCMKIMT